MRIGEVAERSSISTRMLRHYDRIGLVTPSARTEGGYREYDEADLRRLLQVELLRSLGLSLRDAGRALDGDGEGAAAAVSELIAATRERIAREHDLLSRLERIDAVAPADWSDVLGTVAALRLLGDVDASRRLRVAMAAGVEGVAGSGGLVAALRREADPNVAGVLAWALARADDDPVGALEDAARADDPAVRLRAVAAAAKLPPGSADALLAAAVDDEVAEIRARAALALAPRDPGAVLAELVAMVVRGDHDVDAAEAMAAGGEAAVSEAVARVGAVAGHEDPAVRRRIAQALTELARVGGGAAATTVLGSLADDPDRGVAITAMAALGRSPGQRPPDGRRGGSPSSSRRMRTTPS